MSEIQRRLGQLPLRQRVRFLEMLRSGGAARVPDRPVARAHNGRAAASYAQQALWLQQRFDPDGSSYNIALGFRCAGPLDPAALRFALDTVVARHEVLRTTLPEQESGPVQAIAEHTRAELPIVALDNGDWPRAVELARSFAFERFDLATGPLWRAALYRVTEGGHLFVLSVHHAVFDGLSLVVLGRELTEAYRAYRAGEPAVLEPLPVQYADFAVWQREWLTGERLDRLVTYWRGQLADAPVTELPADRPRPASLSYRGSIAQHPLDAGTVEAVHGFAKELAVTPYIVYLTAFFLLVQRYTGQPDLLLGASTGGRSRPELDSLVGCFANLLPLRVELPERSTFRDAARLVDGVVREAFAYVDLPFGEIVRALNLPVDPARQPLAQIVFNLLSGLPVPELGDVVITPEILSQRTAKYDLTVEIADAGAASRVGAEYSTDLFDAETIEALLAQYVRLLGTVTAEPDRAVTGADLLSPDEVDELLHGWDGPRRPVRPVTVHGWFEQRARVTPDAPALIAGDLRLSYAELDQAANRAAQLLLRHGTRPGDRIALCLPRGAGYVTAVLGVLKAGAAFVPLDPKHPAARRDRVLADAGARLVLADPSLADPAGTQGTPVVAFDDAATAGLPGAAPQVTVAPEDLAYVLYTSGSTGVPKGVPIEHRSVVNFVDATRELFALTEHDTFLGYAAYTFDVSIFEMFGALLTGARLCVALDDERLDIGRLQALLERAEVTVTDLPPAVMALLAPEPLHRLRIVFVGGEAFSGEMVNRWNPGRRLFNGYGPTECTVTMVVHECAGTWQGSPPIGLPIRNHVAHVLDRDLQPVPYGVPGELVIGGTGLARGYLHRDDLTAEAFVDDPFGSAPGGRLYRTGDLVKRRRDGALVFLGRIDRQLKVRGIRIESGEIESALTEHPGVDRALVDLWVDERGAKRLVGYVVPLPGAALAPDELRAHATALLPSAVVPEFFVVVPDFPRTTSGKIDRSALPAPQLPAADTASAEHASETERILAVELWAPLLGLTDVNPTVSFFELGGGSLQAAQLITDIRRRFEVEIGVADFFRDPTVAGLAAVVDKQLGERPGQPELLAVGPTLTGGAG
jgi:amino acid adenylation domain-containing protein